MNQRRFVQHTNDDYPLATIVCDTCHKIKITKSSLITLLYTKPRTCVMCIETKQQGIKLKTGVVT